MLRSDTAINAWKKIPDESKQSEFVSLSKKL